MLTTKSYTTFSLFILSILIFTSSCVPISKVKYFNDIDELEEPLANPREQKAIMPFDNVYIRVISIDEKTNQIFNTGQEMRYGAGSAGSMVGYLVNDQGNINFPFVGLINIGGLTTDQASVKIQKALSEYVSNTVVVVKYIDNTISILGEVNRQGAFTFTQEKLTIYEALALGGGLTRFGDRKNVILIRQEGDKIMHHKLNLADSKIAGRDYYYVIPNDILVVEPMKNISWTYQNITYTTALTTISTLIAVLYFAGIRFN